MYNKDVISSKLKAMVKNKGILKFSLASLGIAAMSALAIILFYTVVDNKPEDVQYVGADENLVSNAKVSEEPIVSEVNATAATNLENNNAGNTSLEETPCSVNDMKFLDFNNYNKNCDWKLIVINKYNKLPENFNINLAQVGNRDIDERVAPSLENMINGAKSEGISLWVSSGFRSVGLQTELFKDEVDYNLGLGLGKKEAEAMACTVVAAPGTSEHNAGLAVDFNGVKDDFYTTKEYNWLIQNADKYGFILRYPQDKKSITGVIYEPWHFRYVGVENAKNIKDSKLCLEEYVSNLINK